MRIFYQILFQALVGLCFLVQDDQLQVSIRARFQAMEALAQSYLRVQVQNCSLVRVRILDFKKITVKFDLIREKFNE